MALLTYLEAIRQGLWEEMERDPSVFRHGRRHRRLWRRVQGDGRDAGEFGEERVIDTPICESAIVGAAIGAALMGMRPVVEMQFMDFIACGFDQIVNMAAKMHYRWGPAVPMVIRGPSGAGVHGGPFHSQSNEMWFVHTPGLKVVAPATAYDAKGLIKAAIRDDNPVIFYEHKFLYRRIKEEIPEQDYVVPIGKAAVRRAGYGHRDDHLRRHGLDRAGGRAANWKKKAFRWRSLTCAACCPTMKRRCWPARASAAR